MIEYSMNPSQKVFPLRIVRTRFNQKPWANAVVEGNAILSFQNAPFAGAKYAERFPDSVFSA
jgi:hypothetical protein